MAFVFILVMAFVFVLVAVVVFVLVAVVVFVLVAVVIFSVIILGMRQAFGERPQVHVVGQLQDCALCAAFKVLLHRRQSGSDDHEKIRLCCLADVTWRKGERVGIRPGGNDALDRDPVTADLFHQVLDDRRRSYYRKGGGIVATAALLVVPASDANKRHSREETNECKAKSLEVRQSHRCLHC